MINVKSVEIHKVNAGQVSTSYRKHEIRYHKPFSVLFVVLVFGVEILVKIIGSYCKLSVSLYVSLSLSYPDQLRLQRRGRC